MVEQRLLILANKVAELALEPAGSRGGESSAAGHGGALRPQGLFRGVPAVGDSLDMREQVHLEGVALLKGLSTLQGVGWVSDGAAP